MIRGTTAQFKFQLPYSVSECPSIDVYFWQPNNPNTLLPIKKTKADRVLSMDALEFIIQLTAEETKRFVDRYKAKMQLRAQHISGTSFGTKPQLITVYPMPDDLIIDDESTPIIPPATDEFIIIDGGSIIE